MTNLVPLNVKRTKDSGNTETKSKSEEEKSAESPKKRSNTRDKHVKELKSFDIPVMKM